MRDVESKKAYDLKYAKENIKRVNLEVSEQTYEYIKKYADIREMSVSAFIKEAVRNRMNDIV